MVWKGPSVQEWVTVQLMGSQPIPRSYAVKSPRKISSCSKFTLTHCCWHKGRIMFDCHAGEAPAKKTWFCPLFVDLIVFVYHSHVGSLSGWRHLCQKCVLFPPGKKLFCFVLLFAFLTFCALLPEAAFDLKGVVGQVLLDSQSHSACGGGGCCRWGGSAAHPEVQLSQVTTQDRRQQ